MAKKLNWQWIKIKAAEPLSGKGKMLSPDFYLIKICEAKYWLKKQNFRKLRQITVYPCPKIYLKDGPKFPANKEGRKQSNKRKPKLRFSGKENGFPFFQTNSKSR